MLFAANAFYANVSEPTKIIATMEEDIVKHKDKMFPLDFESLLVTYRHLLAEEIWLLPYPKKML